MLPALFSLFIFSQAAVGQLSVPEHLFLLLFLKSFKPFKVFFFLIPVIFFFLFLNLVVSVSQGNQGRTGVVVAAYMHYSNISARYVVKSCSVLLLFKAQSKSLGSI